MTVLTGKRAIVSGASMGIGRGIAIELAKAGAEVVVNYRSHGEEADDVVAQCVSGGGKAHKIQADFAVQSDVERLVDESASLMGGIDIVVSNAVYSDRHLFSNRTSTSFAKRSTSACGARFISSARPLKSWSKRVPAAVPL